MEFFRIRGLELDEEGQLSAKTKFMAAERD